MTKIALAAYHFLSRHRLLRNALLVVSTIIFILLGVRVQFEEDITKLLPSTGDNSEKLAFSQLRVKDKIFLLITSTDPSAPLSPDDLVEATDDLVDALYQADTTGTVIADILSQVDEETMLDLVSYLADNFPVFVDTADYAQIDSLTTPSCISRSVADTRRLLTTQSGAALKNMLSSDPIGIRNIALNTVKEIRNSLGSNQILYDNHLFSRDTTVALCYVSPAFQSYDSQSGINLVELIEREVSSVESLHDGVKIYFHGAPIQSVNNSRRIKKDLSLTLAISLVLVCIGIGICFKNKSTIPMLILPVVYGAFFALAMMYLVKGSMSLMALGIGAIVLGVALSYCLHVITHYKYVSSPEQVLRDQATPVFLGSLTTIGSFLGLLFTGSELLKDFGLFSSFALVGTTIFCLFFLPHFFNEQRNRKSKKAFKVLERFNSHQFDKHTWLIVLILIISAVCLYTQRWVKFDSDLTHISFVAPQVRESTNLLAAKTQPGTVTTYYATADSSLDVALQKSRNVISILDSLKSQGKVKGFSKAPLLFATQSEQEDRLNAWQNFWSTEKIDATTALVRSECIRQDINPNFFNPFKDFVSADYQPISLYEDNILPEGLVANMIEYTDGQYLVYTQVQLRDEDKKLVGRELVSKTSCLVVDPMFYAEEMVKAVEKDFNTALNISMAFVFIILLLSFKDLILAVVAFIPMSLSWFIVLGVMGILGLQFNLINIVISTFVFGIGVDYSIFVMDGLLSRAKSQSEPQLLIYHKTAIFFSAVVLIVSTGSLLLASHPALNSIGIATIIGMSSAVILAYTLQPFLYHALVKLMLRFGYKAKWLNSKK